MKLNKSTAEIYYPTDGVTEKNTTHLCIAAHHDDIELMALHGVLECFGRDDKWFAGVVSADGAGSPRNGLYARYTDEEMKKVRRIEQKKSAVIGEYCAQFLLDYTSSELRDGSNEDTVQEFMRIIENTAPEVLYTHNPADKHDTHLGVCLRVIEAVRRLPKDKRPKKIYGCEVWRDLDWVNDDQKVVLDVSEHPNIGNALVSVFDSQICGGKRYDLAATGRRTAHATYFASHGVDEATLLSFAIDLTPLIDSDLTPYEYIKQVYIDKFASELKNRTEKLS